MQEISSSRYTGIIGTYDTHFTDVRGLVRRWSFYIRSAVSNQLGRMNIALLPSRAASPESKLEVAITYLGCTGEFLMMTSERMVIPAGRVTLGQLLCRLYKRSNRWENELDDSHLMCTINGRDAKLFDTIAAGAKICISSKKSNFEA